MALRTIESGGRTLRYWLISYDKHGAERREGGEFASEAALDDLARADPTDVFLLSHGWNTGFAQAQGQYDKWITAFLDGRPDDVPTAFRPFVIGVHWPSKAFDDRGLERDPQFTLSGTDDDEAETAAGVLSVDAAVAEYARHLGVGADQHDALHVILSAAAADETLDDPEVTAALKSLGRATGLALEEGSADSEDEAFGSALLDDEADFTLGGDDGKGGGEISPLAALRQLSFWTMKARARSFGASGAADLLREVQKQTERTAGSSTASPRVHLMGHSFGSIVMSAAVMADGAGPLRPLDSLLLAQGALSLWAFAARAHDTKRPGAFRRIVEEKWVAGPIVTTQSSLDYALARYYPLGARVGDWWPGSDQLTLGDLPAYGAIGTFGAQGVDAQGRSIGEIDTQTVFEAGRFYNIESTDVICEIEGVGGAHSDLGHSELGLLAWRAALSGAT